MINEKLMWGKVMIERIIEIGDSFIDSLIILDINKDENPCLYVNATFEKITGYKKDEVIGKSLMLLSGPDTSKLVLEFIEQSFIEHRAFIQDIINYKKSGEPFLCRLVMLPFRNSKGKTLYLGLQNDITNKNFNIMNDKLKLVQSSEICHILNNQIAVLLFKIESMVKGDYNSELILDVAACLKAINKFSVEVEKVSEFEMFKYI